MRKNKLLLLLVLLMTAATGAMAQTETLLTTITPTGNATYSETTAGVVTVTPSNVRRYIVDYGWCWSRSGSVTVEAKEGYTITKCVFKQNEKNPVTITTSPFAITFDERGDCEQNDDMDGVTSIEVYGPADPAPATTGYSVTLAEGTEDADKWTIEPKTGLKGGETVTATYSGEKKVKSVKAVKKAPAYTLLSAATTSDYGKVVCAAGHLHDAKTAVPDGCTAVGILGKVTETGHGLILALQDATMQTWNTINGWTSASSASTTLKVLPDGARGSLTSYTTLGETTVSNWAVAQKSDYEAIFQNLGSTRGDSDGTTYDGNVNAYITGAGGTERSNSYWSTKEYSGTIAWYFGGGCWDGGNKADNFSVWPVLGF